MKNVYGYIYLTTNLVNGKRYIGQHLGQRFERSYFGSGTLLIQAIKKYKTKNFKVELLIWVESNKERVIVKNREISKEMADLDQWEIHYIKDKKSHISYLDENENEMGYNLSWGGHGHGNWSEESKKKQSKSTKKYFETHDPWNKGITQTQEEREEQRQRWFALSKDEKIERSKIISVGMDNMSEEEKQFSISRMKETKANKTQEFKNNKIKKFQKTRSETPQEILDDRIKRGVEKQKQNRFLLSKEELLQKEKLANDKRKLTNDAKSKTEKSDINKKISKANKGIPKTKEHVEKSKIGFKKFLNNMSEEEYTLYHNKKNKKKKETDSKKNTKEVQLIYNKIAEIVKNKPKVACVWCEKTVPLHLLDIAHGKNCKENPDKIWHICKVCGYKGSRSQDLKVHAKKAHYNTPKRTPR